MHAPCVCCGRYDDGREICPPCAEKIAVTPWGVSGLDCGDIRIPILWREAYGGPLTALVVQSKYHGLWSVARLLGRTLGSLPRPWLGSAPIAVAIPLSGSRLANRGYNQSLMIAQAAAAAWNIPVRRYWLQKIKQTSRQASLDRGQRQHNLLGSFRASQAIAGQRVILIDDIMTSGATLREAITAIRQANGTVIGAAVIARVGPMAPTQMHFSQHHAAHRPS